MSQKHPDLEPLTISATLSNGDLTLVALKEIAYCQPRESTRKMGEFGSIDGAFLRSGPRKRIGLGIKGLGEGRIPHAPDLNLPEGTTFANRGHGLSPCDMGVTD